MSDDGSPTQRLVVRFVAGTLLVACIFLLVHKGSRETDAALDRAVGAEARIREEQSARAAAEHAHAATAKDLQDRIQALQKQVADLEAATRAREGELFAARAEVERLRRASEERMRREIALMEENLKLKKALIYSHDLSKETGSADPPKAPDAPAPEAAKPPAERPPPTGLGPTAVTDPGQVRKVLDGLNTLLGGVAGKETYRVVSAEAVEEGRLLRARLEARGEDGGVLKSFKADEVRFLLSAAAGTLAIKLKGGEVIYPGDRTVPFLEGSYAVLLVVDPAPFRASGNPLISVQ